MGLSILEKVKAVYNKTRTSPNFWAKFLGASIPLLFLLYILSLNFSPFGYQKTFVLSIGSENDTKASELYIKPSKDLSDRKITSNRIPYRELNGMSTVIFNPKATLRNAVVDIKTTDPNVSIIPPKIDLQPELVRWDYNWDFTNDIPSAFSTSSAFHFDDSVYLDGKSRLELPDSSQLFEDGPFTIYVEWKPENSSGDFQQIIGHFNWELVQNSNSVLFQVGRMDNASGTIHTIKYSVDENFFQKKHTALAIYQPSENENGFIDLFVDGYFAARKYLGTEKIWREYGKNNLSLGWTPHNYGKNPYFRGSIYNARFSKTNITKNINRTTLSTQAKDPLSFLITSQSTSTVSNLELKVVME